MDMQALLQKIFGAQAGAQAPTMQPSKFQDFGSLLKGLGEAGQAGLPTATPQVQAAPVASSQPDMAALLKSLFASQQPMSGANLHPTSPQSMY